MFTESSGMKRIFPAWSGGNYKIRNKKAAAKSLDLSGSLLPVQLNGDVSPDFIIQAERNLRAEGAHAVLAQHILLDRFKQIRLDQ